MYDDNISALIRMMYTMLCDLSKGYPWRELGIDLERVREDIDNLGIELDDDDET